MAGYNWRDALLLDDMKEWSDQKYTDVSRATGIRALHRHDSRENIARACMLTCGYSLEETFEKDSDRKAFGKEFTALLEVASGKAELEDPSNDRSFQEQARRGINRFFDANPEIEEKFNREYGKNPADFNDKRMAQWTLEEMYYAAMKKVSEIRLPDIDYSNRDQLRSITDRCAVVDTLGNNLNQGLDDGMGRKLNDRYSDLEAYRKGLGAGYDLIKAFKDATMELSDPIDPNKLGLVLGGKMQVDMFGQRLAGASMKEAAQMYTSEDLSFVNSSALPFLINEIKESQYKQVMDYIEGKPRSVAPFYMIEERERQESKNREIITKTPVLSAAYDQEKITFSVDPSALRTRKVYGFDALMKSVKENPAVHAEDPVKRIYIDGKNAYEMFKDKYQGKGTEKEIEDKIKGDIVDALCKVKQRVELARMDLDSKGNPVASVHTIEIDPRDLERTKKWYQSSFNKKAEKLWMNDEGRDGRVSGIIEHAEERQRAQILSNAYNSSFYTGILNEMREAHRANSDQEAQVRDTAVMDRMSAKILETLSHENKSADFRNDIRSIRSLMETAGVTQADMNAFAESLSGETKASFEQIRIWEKNVIHGDPNAAIPSAGDMNVGESVKFMLTMYQNAYYNKLGYEDKLDPAFKSQNHVMAEANVEKKAVTYHDLLLRAGAMQTGDTRVYNPEPAHREHANERQAPRPDALAPRGK